MSCNVDYALRLKYPNTVDVLFLSESGQPIANTADGMIAELQRLCSSTDEPIERRMRPLSNLDLIMNQSSVFMEKIEFFAFDTTIIGGAGQDDTITNALYTSKTTNDVYAQSGFRNAMQAINFQPNFFRPKIWINGTNLLRGMDTFGSNAIADRAIGLPLPYCYERNFEIGHLKSIHLQAKYAQKVENKYLNYPLVAVATFWTV